MIVQYKNYVGCGYFHSYVGWGDWGCSYKSYQPNCYTPNTPPVANNDVISGYQGQAITVSAASLLSNDTDKNGDRLTITSVQSSTHGTVAIVGSNVVFTPSAYYVGPASFTYTITDGKGGYSTASVCVTVNPANIAPDAMNDLVNGN